MTKEPAISLRHILEFEVDLDVVWDTILNDLPPFKEQIKTLLEESKS